MADDGGADLEALLLFRDSLLRGLLLREGLLAPVVRLVDGGPVHLVRVVLDGHEDAASGGGVGDLEEGGVGALFVVDDGVGDGGLVGMEGLEAVDVYLDELLGLRVVRVGSGVADDNAAYLLGGGVPLCSVGVGGVLGRVAGRVPGIKSCDPSSALLVAPGDEEDLGGGGGRVCRVAWWGVAGWGQWGVVCLVVGYAWGGGAVRLGVVWYVAVL